MPYTQWLRKHLALVTEDFYKKLLHSESKYPNIGIKPGRQLPPKRD